MQPSRAHHTWRNAWMLEMLGIATPHPFLMLEERVLWLFRRRAYFLMEKVPAANLIDQLESGDATPGEVAESFEKLFQILHAYRISHGDMKATNFIFSDQKLYVLDLDAMRRHKSQSRFDTASARDLARFQQNWKGSEFEPVFTKMSESAVSSPIG
jgi:tRNA A-37 threonylcarbamoyl transferase component Bud32